MRNPVLANERGGLHRIELVQEHDVSPPAAAAIAKARPNVPHKGTAARTVVPGALICSTAATSRACRAIERWRCSTNFGALVVPLVVKVRHGASG